MSNLPDTGESPLISLDPAVSFPPGSEPSPGEVSGPASSPVSAWVKRFASLIPAGGEVLDLACGKGRHTRYLQSLGYRVEAVDRDEEALASLADLPGVNTCAVDLEARAWPYHGRCFEGVVVTNYLHRPLMPQLFSVLEVGGVLIYETFMEGNQHFGRPSNPAHLLRNGELLALIGRRFTVVAFEQGEVALPRPAVVQRVCAIRAASNRLP